MNHVIIYPSDSMGCGMYRMRWPGDAALAAGHAVNIFPFPKIIVDNGNPPNVRGINVGTANVVVFQRPNSYQVTQAIPILQRKGVSVVIDMDDDFSCIHPRNPAYKSNDPRESHTKNWMHIAKSCELADWVIVTTPALADRYGNHGRCSIIPNHIPEKYLKIKRTENDVPVVGWAGWTSTHVDDLRVTSGMVNQALVETGAKFHGIGDNQMFTQLGIKMRSPHTLENFVPIRNYPTALAKFDIGLVPLQKSDFNEAKSWIKALEYASVGVVPVVSPTYDNMRLVELGAALSAERPKEWYNRVRELVLDDAMRKELSEKARKVAADWTIEGNVSKWVDAWTSARKRQVSVIYS